MGAPKGSKNALGNKGGGRKPIKKEMQELVWILNKWHNEEEIEKLKKKKKLSLREIYLLKAVNGSESILNKLADKILPDKIDLSTKDETFDVEHLTPEEKLAYAKIRLGLFQGSKPSSPEGKSTDLGDGQSDGNGTGKEA